MQKIVISIGGSVLFPKKIDTIFLKNFSSLIKKNSKEKKFFLVVGGGSTARRYIRIGRKLTLDEKTLDDIGISITRINAEILKNILGLKYDIPTNTDDAIEKDSIVVMGGTRPGHSTDMVGAELAEKTKADKFIIATNVDGIFNKDPNKFSDAKMISKISVDKLIKKYGTKWTEAGKNMVVDPPALKIIKRAKIPSFVINGRKLDRLQSLLKNKKGIGTVIKT
ncbi:MAG: UMP kinase [Candidatus Thermoplasmatota archaeon]